VEVPLETDALGPTNFTEALYNLCLERFEDNGVRCVKLSWMSQKMITYGLSLAAQAIPDFL
jgi:hypothetical protein